MIGALTGIAVGVILVFVGIYVLATLEKISKYDRNMAKGVSIAAICIGLLMVIALVFWLYGTQSGARAQKTWSSNTGGGLTRIVTVYDMEGDQIDQYKGKFDVDADENRIIFDIPQPDGSSRRVQIWSSTGTVTIKELDE